MNDLKTNDKETRKRILKEKIHKLKELRSKYGQKMTIARLKKMKGFEKIMEKVVNKHWKALEGPKNNERALGSVEKTLERYWKASQRHWNNKKPWKKYRQRIVKHWKTLKNHWRA